MISKMSAMILCILGPYLLGAVGNASFLISHWGEFSRWVMGIISLTSFTIVSFALESPVKQYKERL